MAENVGAVSLGVNLNGSDLNSQVNSLGSSIGATFRGILSNAFSFALGQGLFSFITNGFRESVGAAWDFDSTMQSATTSFTTLLHSASGASSLVSQLNAINQVSTLDMTDLSKAAQEMISFGVNSSSVIPTIKELGDISQGNSEKFNALALAFSQTSSAGKLTGQDLLQYISAGFNPLQVIAQKTGKSMADLRTDMENGKISAQDVADAFQTATSAGGAFYNATANASKTESGQMAILGASVTETLGAMIKPAFTDFTSNVLPHLISVMGTVSDTFTKTGSVTGAVAAGLKAAFGPQVSGAFTTLAAGVQGTIGWIADHGTLVTSVLAGTAGAMTAFKVATIAINTVTSIHNGLLLISKAIETTSTGATLAQVAATKTATGAQIGLNMALLANPITWIVIGIAALVAAMVVLFNKNKTFHDFVVSAFTNIKAVVIGAFTQMQAVIMPIVQVIRQTLTAAWSVVSSTILSGLQTVQAWWNKIWPELSSVLSTVWGIIKNVISGAFLLIYPIISSYLGFIRGLWTGVWGIIRDTFIGVWNIIVDVVKMVWGVISNEVKAGLDLVSGLFTVFKDILSGNWSGAWHDLVSTVRNVGGDLWGAVRSLFGGVWNILGDVAGTAENWGRDIIQGIVNGIKDAASAVGDAVKGVAQDIRSFLHFSVPDQGPLVDFQSWMPDFIGGLASGITNSKSILTSAVSGMAMELNSAVKTGVGGALGSVSIHAGSTAAQQTAGTGVTYKQENYISSPKALSPSEVARQTRNAQRQFVLRTVSG